jgi:hypothetical protein
MNAKRQTLALQFRRITFALVTAQFAVQILHASPHEVDYVIHISVDGLRPDAITVLGPTNLPNFYRMRTQGVFTDNARTDYDATETLPDHTSQLTGRAVLGTAGHNWTDDDDPAPGATLASNKGAYIAGVFDVAHDNGLRTGEFASKSKFSLFATSWNAANGAPDTTGSDDGRNKIDVYLNTDDTTALVTALVTNMTAQPFNYVFLHLADPDVVGHASGWDVTPGSAYSNAVKTMDSRLGSIFSVIDSNLQLAGHTALILTTDHGGSGYTHYDPTLPADYTVPFYVWGPGVMSGADLYALNPATRLNPGTNRPTYAAPIQPIRNGDVANVALKLLGLGPVAGSTINHAQDLELTIQSPTDFRLILAGTNVVLKFTTVCNVLYNIQRRDDLISASWSNIATDILGTGGVITIINVGAATTSQQLYRLQLHF